MENELEEQLQYEMDLQTYNESLMEQEINNDDENSCTYYGVFESDFH